MAPAFNAKTVRTDPIGKSGRMTHGAGGRFSGLTTAAAALQLGIEAKISAQLDAQLKEVAQTLEKNAIYSIKGAAYDVTQEAKASIVAVRGRGTTKGGRGGRASAPGKPPHTRGIPSKNLRFAIEYAVLDRELDAIIGPSGEVVGDVGRAHEYGGRRGKNAYPPRPFMGPALERSLPRIPQRFRDIM